MYEILLNAHSIVRFAVLIFVVLAILLSFAGWFRNKDFTKGNKMTNLFALISTHLQAVLGLILYFVSPWVRLDDMGGAMKDSTARYWTVEHILIMLIAVVLITIGYSKSKRALTDLAKHRTVAIYFTIGAILVIVGILMSDRALLGMGTKA